MKFASLLTAGTLAIATTALQAQTNVTPNLSAGVGSFYTDRYAPAGFATNNGIQGRNDVLQITIDASTNAGNRGGLGATFYNTQGKKTDVNTAGSWFFRSDLYVAEGWATPRSNGYVRTDMWATSTDNPTFTNPSAYPIVGFTNFGGAARFRGWNGGSWTDFSSTVNFGQWNTLEMMFDENSDLLSYFVNGVLAGTVNDVVSTGVGNVMYQAYNFNDPALSISGNPDYVTNWSNTAVVPEPSTYALLATGLALLAAGARRRRRTAAE